MTIFDSDKSRYAVIAITMLEPAACACCSSDVAWRQYMECIRNLVVNGKWSPELLDGDQTVYKVMEIVAELNGDGPSRSFEERS